MKHLTRKTLHTTLLASGLLLMTACGGGGGESSIDLAEYRPAESVVKHYTFIEKQGSAAREEFRITETLTVTHADIHTTYIETEQKKETLDGTLLSTENEREAIFEDTIRSDVFRQDIARYIHIGDSVFDEAAEVSALAFTDDDGHTVPVMFDCTYKNTLVDLDFGDIAYEGEILETECVFSSAPFILGGEERQFHVSSFLYEKKGIGTIASKTVHCKIDTNILNDLDMGSCPENNIYYEILLLDPTES